MEEGRLSGGLQHVYLPTANGRGDVGATTTVEERLERQRRRVWVGFQ